MDTENIFNEYECVLSHDRSATEERVCKYALLVYRGAAADAIQVNAQLHENTDANI